MTVLEDQHDINPKVSESVEAYINRYVCTYTISTMYLSQADGE